MKKIIIISLIFSVIIICFFGNIAWSLFSSTKEIREKQDKLKDSNIIEMTINDKNIDGENQVELKKMLENFNYEDNRGSITLGYKKMNINTKINIITTNKEMIDFNFSFSRKCWDNKVKVKKGFLSSDTQELCEFIYEILGVK
ncbi:MAG: hypothetical protein KBF12_11960 [Sebaldella sp.]|nr:hypothetical protein [Sebaldella sp.]